MNLPQQQPTLTTERLVLRPFQMNDVSDVVSLLNEKRISQYLSLVPHPYGKTDAEGWISTHEQEYQKQKSIAFAITLKKTETLIGCIGIHPKEDGLRAEFGYWVGLSFWNNGYCTEAAKAIFEFSFNALQLKRIFACHFIENPASGRVMQKLGMQREGIQRWGASRFGVLYDSVCYGITQPEWINLHSHEP